MTQDCKNTYVAFFACKLNTLSDKYENSLNIGSSCADNYLFQLEIGVALNEILCSINVEEDSCLNEEQICNLIENLKQLLNNKPCGC